MSEKETRAKRAFLAYPSISCSKLRIKYCERYQQYLQPTNKTKNKDKKIFQTQQKFLEKANISLNTCSVHKKSNIQHSIPITLQFDFVNNRHTENKH